MRIEQNVSATPAEEADDSEQAFLLPALLTGLSLSVALSHSLLTTKLDRCADPKCHRNPGVIILKPGIDTLFSNQLEPYYLP